MNMAETVNLSEVYDITKWEVVDVGSKQLRPLVLAHGCFDLLHLGHIRHLHEAKKLGAYLVVSVTSDRFVAKGDGRPHFTAKHRAEALRALDCVDEVRITDAPDALPIIAELLPDFYVKGSDYDTGGDARLEREREFIENSGGKFVVTRAEKWSSSRLINAETYSPDVAEYLRHAREADFWPRIEAAFGEARKLKVAMIGESILDQYVYVSPLSKPSKEFVLAAAEQNTENFLGGIDAAAAHTRSLCLVGTVTQPTNKPLRKRRYVEQGFTRKIFEVYSAPRLELDEATRDILMVAAQDAILRSDAVIVIDFGHGLIDHGIAQELYDAKFLAVNAQTNAGNQGFNPVTKYHRADYVCVDLPEARLAAQKANAEPKELIDFLTRKMGGPHVIVTHGREGAHWGGGTVPAFAQKPIDTMGAGDCFIALTAPLIAVGLGTEEAAFVGCVAAGMKTGIVGHREAVNADKLLQTVRSLLQ